MLHFPSGSVQIENILGYIQNRPKYVTKGRGQDFREAIKECDTFISNPQVICVEVWPISISINYHCFICIQAQLKTENRSEVVVKTEFDFVVKQENASDPMYRSEVVQLSVQANNIKQPCQNCESLEQQVKELTERSHFMEKQHETDSKRVIALNQEIDDLKTQVEKMKSELNPEYEVECLLGHKKVKGVLLFLVRWKGYSSEDDTWERKDNLKCPQILNRYLKLNSL